MRSSFLICLLITMTQACSSLKITGPKVTNCPSDGTCDTEIFENQRFELKRDQFGKSYLETTENEGARQLKISFYKNGEESIADSQYIEEIYLPLDRIESQINLSKDHFEINVLYGRIGNFRGEDLYHIKKNVVARVRKQNGNTYISIMLNQPELAMNQLTLALY